MKSGADYGPQRQLGNPSVHNCSHGDFSESDRDIDTTHGSSGMEVSAFFVHRF